ncbi:hypothetical protein Tcan_13249 [Toxocara canis]|uniref:KANL2-like probable zinc-finger domain-containing protein n=1 Tax=Toxocara canis TaxID=6265 RepID=A0A0B2VZM3_TOXCA|nr:hypothetical protein Tcan_13249 [Toxocara canis]
MPSTGSSKSIAKREVKLSVKRPTSDSGQMNGSETKTNAKRRKRAQKRAWKLRVPREEQLGENCAKCQYVSRRIGIACDNVRKRSELSSLGICEQGSETKTNAKRRKRAQKRAWKLRVPREEQLGENCAKCQYVSRRIGIACDNVRKRSELSSLGICEQHMRFARQLKQLYIAEQYLSDRGDFIAPRVDEDGIVSVSDDDETLPTTFDWPWSEENLVYDPSSTDDRLNVIANAEAISEKELLMCRLAALENKMAAIKEYREVLALKQMRYEAYLKKKIIEEAKKGQLVAETRKEKRQMRMLRACKRYDRWRNSKTSKMMRQKLLARLKAKAREAVDGSNPENQLDYLNVGRSDEDHELPICSFIYEESAENEDEEMSGEESSKKAEGGESKKVKGRQCTELALPRMNYCLRHVFENGDQQMFAACLECGAAALDFDDGDHYCFSHISKKNANREQMYGPLEVRTSFDFSSTSTPPSSIRASSDSTSNLLAQSASHAELTEQICTHAISAVKAVTAEVAFSYAKECNKIRRHLGRSSNAIPFAFSMTAPKKNANREQMYGPLEVRTSFDFSSTSTPPSSIRASSDSTSNLLAQSASHAELTEQISSENSLDKGENLVDTSESQSEVASAQLNEMSLKLDNLELKAVGGEVLYEGEGPDAPPIKFILIDSEDEEGNEGTVQPNKPEDCSAASTVQRPPAPPSDVASGVQSLSFVAPRRVSVSPRKKFDERSSTQSAARTRPFLPKMSLKLDNLELKAVGGEVLYEGEGPDAPPIKFILIDSEDEEGNEGTVQPNKPEDCSAASTVQRPPAPPSDVASGVQSLSFVAPRRVSVSPRKKFDERSSTQSAARTRPFLPSYFGESNSRTRQRQPSTNSTLVSPQRYITIEQRTHSEEGPGGSQTTIQKLRSGGPYPHSEIHIHNQRRSSTPTNPNFAQPIPITASSATRSLVGSSGYHTSTSMSKLTDPSTISLSSSSSVLRPQSPPHIKRSTIMHRSNPPALLRNRHILTQQLLRQNQPSASSSVERRPYTIPVATVSQNVKRAAQEMGQPSRTAARTEGEVRTQASHTSGHRTEFHTDERAAQEGVQVPIAPEKSAVMAGDRSKTEMVLSQGRSVENVEDGLALLADTAASQAAAIHRHQSVSEMEQMCEEHVTLPFADPVSQPTVELAASPSSMTQRELSGKSLESSDTKRSQLSNFGLELEDEGSD